MLAGVEPMSEPRNKEVAQSAVRSFYEGVCATVSSVDPRLPCVVGPAPYYKVWNLNSTMLLRTAGGKPMENIIYTFGHDSETIDPRFLQTLDLAASDIEETADDVADNHLDDARGNVAPRVNQQRPLDLLKN